MTQKDLFEGDEDRLKLSKDELRYLNGPVVFADASWGSVVPEDILAGIPERRVEILTNREIGVTLNEYLAYLMTATYMAPLSEDLYKIYVAVCMEWSKGNPRFLQGMNDIFQEEKISGIDSLDEYHLGVYRKLGYDIRDKVVKEAKKLE